MSLARDSGMPATTMPPALMAARPTGTTHGRARPPTTQRGPGRGVACHWGPRVWGGRTEQPKNPAIVSRRRRRRFSRAVLQQLTRDHDLLYFGRAFVDSQRADLAVKLFHLDAFGDAEAPMELHGAIDHTLRRLGREHFRCRRLPRNARGALVLGPGSAIDEQGRCVDLAGAIGHRPLRELQLGERGAEELAACGALNGFMQRAPRKTECGGTHGRTEDVERRHRDLETVAGPAQAIPNRHADAFES